MNDWTRLHIAVSSDYWSFWNTLVLLLFAIPLILLAALALLDTFRRPELSRRQRAGWVVVIVLVPLIGPICYLLLRPEAAHPPDLHLKGTATGDRAQEAPATRAEQLHMLSRLHDAGKLTDSEFAAAKIRVLRDNGVTTRH